MSDATIRVLIAPFHERGHYSSMLAVGRTLVDQGHTVAFTCTRDLRPNLAALEMPAEFYLQGTGEIVRQRTRIQDEKFMSRWYKLAATGGFSEVHTTHARAAIEAFRPDVICVDPIAYPSIIAASRAGIPWACATVTFLMARPPGFSSTMTRALETQQHAIAGAFQAAGCDVRLAVHEVLSPWCNMMFGTEELVGRPSPDDPAICFAGPVHWHWKRGDAPAFPWDRLDPTGPMIYGSSGGGDSLAYPDETVRAIADAIEPGMAQLVFSLQDAFDRPVAADLPAHVLGVRYAPQLDLLARASVAITHGGSNSVAECLMMGRPMLVLPIGHDQPLQAYLVERAGAGLALPLDAPAASIRDALRALLMDPRYREAASRLQRAYRDRDGGAFVASRLVELGTRRRGRAVADT